MPPATAATQACAGCGAVPPIPAAVRHCQASSGRVHSAAKLSWYAVMVSGATSSPSTRSESTLHSPAQATPPSTSSSHGLIPSGERVPPSAATPAADRSTPRTARDPGARRAMSAPKATTKHASVP